jgi:hypothetical protein
MMGSHTACMGNAKYIHIFAENLKRQDSLENLSTDGMVLK